MSKSSLNFNIILSVVLIAGMAISCGRKNRGLQQVDSAFAEYISAFTPPLISKADDIRIVLRDDQPGVEPGTAADEKLFSFSPKIKGSAVWLDARTLEFRPDDLLPSGTEFRGKFRLDLLMDVPSELKKFEFPFQTLKQAVDVDFEGLQAYNYEELTWQKVLGTVSTADYANADKIQESFAASQENEKLNITWQHSEDGKTHSFTIDSIRRSERKSEVVLTWNAKDLESETADPMHIDIPPLGDFKVLKATFVSEPEQMILLNFSDPVSREQDLEGLIHLQSGTGVRLVKEENVVKVIPRRRLDGTFTVIVEQSVRNSLGYELTEEFKITKSFSTIKPKIEILGDGVIVPGADGIMLPFKAVNLSGINVKIIKIYENNIAQFFQVNQFDNNRELTRVGRLIYNKNMALTSDKAIDYGEWNNFSLDLSELIETEPGAIYRVVLGFSREQSLYPCESDDESYTVTTTIDEETELDDSQYDGPDTYYSYSYYYYDDFKWSEREDPCKPSYYMTNQHIVTRNVFASNLGVIAKSGDANNMLVVVTDMLTTKPVSGVEVEIYNYQNQLMGTVQTNQDGFARVDVKKKPFLLVAKKDNQYGYLRLDDGSALSLSMFDIDGNKLEKGVKGFLYGERGVWRPGDSIYLSFILEDDNNEVPPHHPVIFELYTPENQQYQRIVKTSSLNGFYNFNTATDPEAPTGNWLAKVKVGASEFTKTIRIETVKPNRLKIDLDFGSDIIESGTSTGKLTVKWLHGAVAKNLKADISVRLMHGNTTFENYPNYVFDNPAKEFYTEEKNVFRGSVNEEGVAEVNTTIDVGSNAPGMLKAVFKTRAFEESGDFSVDQYTIPLSPFQSYAGLKVPEGKGWNGALYGDQPNMIPIVTVDQQGNPVDRDDVKVEVYSIRWRWWWERYNEDDLAEYISSYSSNKIITEYVDTKNGSAQFEMNIPDDYIWGRKYIVVTDPESGHSAGQVFYTSYKSWWRSSGGDAPGGAEMLTFTTDKKEYQVGEKINVELPPSKIGKALVSLESGSRVIDNFWVDVNEDNNTFNFVATPDMAPNIYIHLSYIQPHNQTGNDHPIRMYGIQPVKVIDPDTKINPVIEMPDELQPEKEVTIKVSEQDGKRMTYTVAVVDEGLLDLTRFQTPEAWHYFYAREALGIKTWDMYRYVMGAFTGEFAGLIAIGGDEELDLGSKEKANRFKPVVKYFGPFELKSGTNKHTFTMPNYVGSVRTMVVAGQDGAYGSAEKATPVRNPVMVLATLPRVVSPGETLKLPVTVFAMDEKIKNVTVEVEGNEMFDFVGGNSKSLTYTQTGEQVVYFDIKVADNIGIGEVKVTATGGSNVATDEIEIDVRIPNPRITRVTSGYAEGGKSWDGTYEPMGIRGTNMATIELSGFPPMNIEKRLKFLIRYPHGCIEQTTSSVFPQLFLDNLVDMSNVEKATTEDNIKAGIDRLRLFQTPRGGLSYWPGNMDHENDWGTNYAGHFMLEAKAKGYDLPSGFLKKWIEYQTERANSWQNQPPASTRYYNYPSRSRQMIQAYRLYTLALADKPAMGAMNRMRELDNLTVSASWRLAAAYAAAGRKKVANEIIENLPKKVEPYQELAYSYGSNERDMAMILETLIMLDRTDEAKDVLDAISDNMASDKWYSTQTTAYSLMAAAKFIGVSGSDKEMDFAITVEGDKGESIKTDAPFTRIELPVESLNERKVSIENKSEAMLFIRVHSEGIPIVDNSPDFDNDLKMSIRYLDLDGNPINPESLIQGTDFMLEVDLAHPGIKPDYHEMALTQIFPSGWEIRNLRMEQGESTLMRDEPEYQDIRDDRVYSYFDLRRGGSKTFRVILHAAYLGEFYMPAIYCEAMYDREISAKKGGGWVKVNQPR